MRIDGTITNQNITQTAKSAKTQEELPIAENSTPVVEQSPATETDDAKGVLRLLQEGHFKGVADVRLRINFFEEIQAIENDGLKESAEAGFQTFNQSIADPLGDLEESGELTEEQLAAMNAFLDNIQTMQGDFLNNQAPSIEDLLNSLQSEFDNLSSLFSPPPPPAEPPLQDEEPLVAPQIPSESDTETPAEELPATDPISANPVIEEIESLDQIQPTETTEILSENTIFDLFQSLQETFLQAMENLQSNLSGSQVMPEISAPSGNGKAFEKFMAIYEAMRNAESDPAPQIDNLEPAE